MELKFFDGNAELLLNKCIVEELYGLSKKNKSAKIGLEMFGKIEVVDGSAFPSKNFSSIRRFIFCFTEYIIIFVSIRILILYYLRNCCIISYFFNQNLYSLPFLNPGNDYAGSIQFRPSFMCAGTQFIFSLLLTSSFLKDETPRNHASIG